MQMTDYGFDRETERFRLDESGQFAAGPPKDWDTDADQFRSVDTGKFKDQGSYGPDNERSTAPELPGHGGSTDTDGATKSDSFLRGDSFDLDF